LNWYRHYHNLLEKYDCLELIDKYRAIDEYCSINLVRNEIVRKLAVVQDILVQNDIILMQNGMKMPLYKTIRTHCKLSEIMSSNVGWNLIILFVQIK
jgi:hypothetical protein